MNLQPVGIVIDARPAKEGAAEVAKAIETIPPKLRAVQGEANKTAESLGQVGKASALTSKDLAALDHYAARVAANMAAGNTKLAEGQARYATATYGAEAFAAAQARVAASAAVSASATASAASATAGMGAAASTTVPAVAAMTTGATAATGAFAALSAVLTGAFIVAVLAAVAALAGLGLALGALSKGIPLAAEAEDYRITFETLIGNAERAHRTLRELYEFADKTPFEIKDVVPQAQKLLAVGVGTDDLIDKIRRLGDIASANPRGAQAFDGIVSAYEKVRARNRITQEEVRSFINSGFNLLPVLAKVRGETEKGLIDSIRKGVVGFNDLDKAIKIATDSGGQFYNLMERRSQSLSGLQSTARDTLNAVFRALGEAPADALRPVLAAVIDQMEKLIPTAKSVGQQIADAITIAFGLLSNGTLFQVISLKMESAFLGSVIAVRGFFSQLWDDFISFASRAIVAVVEKIKGIPAAISGILSSIANAGGGSDPFEKRWQARAPASGPDPTAASAGHVGGAPGWAEADQYRRANVDLQTRRLLDAAYESGRPRDTSPLIERPGSGRSTVLGNPTGNDKGKEKEYKEDIDAIITMQREIRQLQEVMDAGQVSQTEYKRRLEAIKEAATAKLYDPQAWTQYGIEPWRAFQAERVRAAKQADAEIKAGTAGYFESFARGVEKAIGSVQTMQSRLKDAGEQITNSLVNGLLGAFDAIISGSKTAGQAFREFAATFLKEIALMIIKAVILATLQMIIGAAVGRPISFTNALLGNVGIGKRHNGGTIGGSGSSGTYYMPVPKFHEGGWPGLADNEVPIIAEKGEEVIPKGGRRGGDSLALSMTLNLGDTGGRADPSNGRATLEAVRSVVTDTLVRESRPGGIIYNARRGG